MSTLEIVLLINIVILIIIGTGIIFFLLVRFKRSFVGLRKKQEAVPQITISQNMNSSSIPFNQQSLRLNSGIHLSYYEEGSGRHTLLFIHGLGSNKKCWRKNISVLRNHCRCIALDLPGYGDSSIGSFPYNMSFFATVINDFVIQKELTNVTVVGHSMGGQVAMTVCLNFPALARQVFLIAPAGFERFNAAEIQLARGFYASALIKALPVDQIRRNFELNFYDFPEDAEFMIQDRLKLRATPAFNDFCKMIPKCVMGMLREPVFKRLPNLPIPTKVVFGKNDRLIPNPLLHPTQTTIAIAKAGTRQIPNASLELLEECGHFVQWEKPEQVNQLIVNFLAE